MLIEFDKRPITITFLISASTTFILAVLSIINGSSWLFRISLQGSMCITMFLNGARYFIYRKEYSEALVLWIVSGLFLYLFINTLRIGVKFNLF